MKVIRIIKREEENVKTCGQCPYFNPSKEFSVCDKLVEDGVQFPDTVVHPAWEEVIDEKCPLK